MLSLYKLKISQHKLKRYLLLPRKTFELLYCQCCLVDRREFEVHKNARAALLHPALTTA